MPSARAAKASPKVARKAASAAQGLQVLAATPRRGGAKQLARPSTPDAKPRRQAESTPSKSVGAGKTKERSAPSPRNKVATTNIPPTTWKHDYPLIEKLRATRDAPVDYVGCERLADLASDQSTYEWQCLVASMLSSMTKDQANAEAMAQLQVHGNTVQRIAETPVEEIDRLIAKVGFHATKAKSLQAAARICIEKHGGRVPRTLEGLMALPGVGPKMAHLTMHAAFDEQVGICVDTHVHRIANALGWLESRSAEETRIKLEAWLPKKHWPGVNVLLVGFGQQQQQEPQKLVERSLKLRPPLPALKLLARIGLPLRADRSPALACAAERNPEISKLLSPAGKRRLSA